MSNDKFDVATMKHIYYVATMKRLGRFIVATFLIMSLMFISFTNRYSHNFFMPENCFVPLSRLIDGNKSNSFLPACFRFGTIIAIS